MDPSVGRIVLVAFKIKGKLVERPAVVTSLAEREGVQYVHVFVFREGGDETSHGVEANMVWLRQAPDNAPTDGHWRWPPRESKPRKNAAAENVAPPVGEAS